MAAAAKKAAKDREDALMDRFQTMQDGMTKAMADQSKASALEANKRQEELLKTLIPQLLQGQPGAGIKTATNNLGAGSHSMPSTGLIAAAASGYDAQTAPQSHLVGGLSSGVTADNQGKLKGLSQLINVRILNFA
jgi:hypothetical protein